MKRYLNIALFFALAGCGSFNNNFNTNPNPQVIPHEVVPEDDGKTNAEEALLLSPGITGNGTELRKDAPMCPFYKFKELPKTPPLPMADLLAAGNNLAEIERVERKHIDELRSFITTMKQGLTLNRHQYLALCQAAAQSTPSK